MHSIAPKIELSEAKAAASYAAGTTGQAGADLTKYHGELDVFISVGSVGAAGTLDAKWQESTDNVTFTDAAGADTQGNAVSITQIAAAGTARLKRSVRKFTKRYARVLFTVGVNAVVFGAVMAVPVNKAE